MKNNSEQIIVIVAVAFVMWIQAIMIFLKLAGVHHLHWYFTMLPSIALLTLWTYRRLG